MEQVTLQRGEQLCIGPRVPSDVPYGSVTIREGAGVSVSVILGCEPCATVELEEPRCEVQRDGSTLSVSAHAVAHVDRSVDLCTLDCRIVLANCETPALEAGDYRLVLGNESLDIAVPSTTACACSDDPCCETDADCSPPQRCDTGRGICAPADCQTDSECDSPSRCDEETHQCALVQCSENEPCPVGLTCPPEPVVEGETPPPSSVRNCE